MRKRHSKKLVSAALALLALACVWFFFAPTRVGGSTSYVVTDGISMEPRFHSGDLALVRSQSRYSVGEIVAYHSNAFHTIVLHRIIGRHGAQYLFKGDNNNFVDFEHPTANQLIGSLWLHIPGAGAELHSLRSPLLIATLIGFGTLLFAGAAFAQKRRRRGRARRVETAGGHRLAAHRRPAMPAGGVLAVAALALLPFLALATLAFTRSATALLPFSAPYKQSATFSYSAKAPPGPIYASNRAVTGDPLFTHVLHSVGLQVDYRFSSAAPHKLAGRAALYASVASTSGWKTTFALAGSRRFHGDSAHLAATLDLASLLALVRHVESTTDVSGSYTLTLTPHLSTSGTVGGSSLHRTYAPELKFTVNQLEVQPLTAANGASTAQNTTTPFSFSALGTATGKRAQAGLLTLGPVRMAVTTARWTALGGAALVICALLALRMLLRPRTRDESQTIRARYGRMIVPVERVWHLPELAVIDVPDIESLVRIAEHYERSILHERSEDGEAFWVTDESGQFRYAPGPRWSADEEADVRHAAEPAVHEPVHEPYTLELEIAPVVSAYDAREVSESIAAYSALDGQIAPADAAPASAPHQEQWQTGHEAAETYAGWRAKGFF